MKAESIKRACACALIGSLLTGVLECSATSTQTGDSDALNRAESDRFWAYDANVHRVDGNWPIWIREYILVDQETGVHYLVIDNAWDGISVTPLYNSDGSMETSIE